MHRSCRKPKSCHIATQLYRFKRPRTGTSEHALNPKVYSVHRTYHLETCKVWPCRPQEAVKPDPRPDHLAAKAFPSPLDRAAWVSERWLGIMTVGSTLHTKYNIRVLYFVRSSSWVEMFSNPPFTTGDGHINNWVRSNILHTPSTLVIIDMVTR